MTDGECESMLPRKSLLDLIESEEKIDPPSIGESDHGEKVSEESFGRAVHHEMLLGHSGIHGIIPTNVIQF